MISAPLVKRAKIAERPVTSAAQAWIRTLQTVGAYRMQVRIMACALSRELRYRLGLNTKSLRFIARPLMCSRPPHAGGTRTSRGRRSNSGSDPVNRSLPLTRQTVY